MTKVINYIKQNWTTMLGSFICSLVMIAVFAFHFSDKDVKANTVLKEPEVKVLPHIMSDILETFEGEFTYHYACFYNKIYYVEPNESKVLSTGSNVILLVTRPGYSGGYSCNDYSKLKQDYSIEIEG